MSARQSGFEGNGTLAGLVAQRDAQGRAVFDPARYLARYVDVAAAAVDPLRHYLESGVEEDREPNALFDPAWYREQHPELRQSGEPPLLHYLEHDRDPGVYPNERFGQYAGFFRDGPETWARIADDLDNPLRDHLALGLSMPAGEAARLALPYGQPPVVSIVIPAFEQVPHTVACLRSIAAARGRVAFEVIVADDASRRASYPELLRGVAGVRVVRHEQNLGFVRSCNAAARAARAPFLLFLNNDTTVCDDWLDELVATFGRFPGTGIVGAKTLFPNGRVAEAGGIVWRDGSAWNFGRHESARSPELDYAREADYVSGAVLMIERTLFEELGGFDEHFGPAYYEDTDLAFRARAAGRRVVYQPAAEVIHFEGASHGTDESTGGKAYQRINAGRFFERWRDVLAAHGENAVHPEREKDRATRHEALLVQLDSSARELSAVAERLIRLAQALGRAGYRVSYAADTPDGPGSPARALRSHGVRVLLPPASGGVANVLAGEGARFEVCLLCDEASPRARFEHACPNARVIVDRAGRPEVELLAELLDDRQDAPSSP